MINDWLLWWRILGNGSRHTEAKSSSFDWNLIWIIRYSFLINNVCWIERYPINDLEYYNWNCKKVVIVHTHYNVLSQLWRYFPRFFLMGNHFRYNFYGKFVVRWGPNRVFGKMWRLGLLSVKKVKTQFLSNWRNEDWRFVQNFRLWNWKNEENEFLSVKTLMSTLVG